MATSRWQSPRLRRRLLVVGCVVAVGVVTGLVFLLLPNDKGGLTSPVSSGPVQVVTHARQLPVTPADRKAIDALLDRFVPAAVSRRHPEAAWDLATASMRTGTTRADWAAGNLPVQPYDARGTAFHDWHLTASVRNLVTLELNLQPRSAGDGAASYLVDVKRVRGRWLVDSAYQRATYAASAAPGKTTAATTTTTTVATSHADRGRIGAIWLLVPLGLLSLIVIVPILLLIRGWVADKRVDRRTRNDPSRQLPPLPRPQSRDRPPGG